MGEAMGCGVGPVSQLWFWEGGFGVVMGCGVGPVSRLWFWEGGFGVVLWEEGFGAVTRFGPKATFGAK